MQPLRERILDELSWDMRFEDAQIDAEVSDGRVRLLGEVNSLAQFEDAELAVSRIPGVKGIDNRLVISVPRSEDELIAQALSLALASDSEIDEKTVEFTVEDGVVLLRGTVDSIWQKQRVSRLASGTSEVVVVENRLQVVPTHDLEDRGIAGQIERVLELTDEIDEQNITVVVNRGRVVLKGRVPHRNAFLAAEYAALHTRGVIEVKNELVIT
ncbi:osmotically inducible protein OsmY [Chitinispirillum alkaliphilum]|nr:osmotically inducible protein OsmY [Chitinispirillum alkaliphilum]